MAWFPQVYSYIYGIIIIPRMEPQFYFDAYLVQLSELCRYVLTYSLTRLTSALLFGNY